MWKGRLEENAVETLVFPNPMSFTGAVGFTGAVKKGKDAVATVAATRTILASESGTVFFFGHSTEFVMTLPAVAAGLRYTFICTAAPSGANYTIVTDASANVLLGQVYSSDLDATGNADFATSGEDTITFVGGKAVVGDRVEVFCDGTNWFAYCFCSLFDAITITTAS